MSSAADLSESCRSHPCIPEQPDIPYPHCQVRQGCWRRREEVKGNDGFSHPGREQGLFQPGSAVAVPLRLSPCPCGCPLAPATPEVYVSSGANIWAFSPPAAAVKDLLPPVGGELGLSSHERSISLPAPSSLHGGRGTCENCESRKGKTRAADATPLRGGACHPVRPQCPHGTRGRPPSPALPRAGDAPACGSSCGSAPGAFVPWGFTGAALPPGTSPGSL